MKFFDSEVVKEELTRMQDLYLEINKMGLMLSVPQKREQLDKMIELINNFKIPTSNKSCKNCSYSEQYSKLIYRNTSK